MNKNLPNIITIVRVCLLPFIFFFYLTDFVPYSKIVGISLYIFACITDFLDGFLARKYNAVSDFGKLIDPMADKLLSCTGIILIAVSNVLPDWFFSVMAFIILGRDFSVDCLRMLAAKNGVVIAANWSGKIRTILSMIAMPYLMFMSTKIINKDVFDYVGYGLMGLAVILCAYSWFFYFYTNRSVFKTNDNKSNNK